MRKSSLSVIFTVAWLVLGIIGPAPAETGKVDQLVIPKERLSRLEREQTWVLAVSQIKFYSPGSSCSPSW